MPRIEIEIDDKGEFIGQVPTELGGILDRLKATAHGEGYGKGASKAAEEAKAQIDAAIKAEKLKLEAQMPLEKAKWDDIDQQNKVLKTQLESTATEARKQLTAREEAHAVEITKKLDALTKRDAKIKTLVNATLRGLAAQSGARDESLSELEVILQHRIGYSDDMEPFVKDESGEPARTAAGNPLGLDVFVKQYLDNHPHHRKPTPGKNGDARRGASFAAQPGSTSIESARQRIESGDRSPGAINDLFEASRRRAS
jgi:hypothetical protein